MSEKEIRERVLLLGFGGDHLLFMAFHKRLQADLPPGTGVVLRGSVVTNKRWEDGKPFDAVLGQGGVLHSGSPHEAALRRRSGDCNRPQQTAQGSATAGGSPG